MPINIKDTSKLAEKFSRRAGGATTDYRDGIASPKQPQAESAIAAVDVWHASVTSPEAKVLYVKKLQRAGNEKWFRKANGVGGDRYATGAQAAKQDWATGVEPYLAALRSMTLPPKGLRRSPQNVARVQAVIDTLGKVKTGGA